MTKKTLFDFDKLIQIFPSVDKLQINTWIFLNCPKNASFLFFFHWLWENYYKCHILFKLLFRGVHDGCFCTRGRGGWPWRQVAHPWTALNFKLMVLLKLLCVLSDFKRARSGWSSLLKLLSVNEIETNLLDHFNFKIGKTGKIIENLRLSWSFNPGV